MANNANIAPLLSLESLLEKDRLSGTNLFNREKLSDTNLVDHFRDWHNDLKIFLKHEQLLYVLDADARVPDEPDAGASRTEKNLYEKHARDSTQVASLMIFTMDPSLQEDLELLEPYDIITNLKEMFETQTRYERFETRRALFSCKMVEGTSVGSHVLKMKGYIDRLAFLGSPLNQEIAANMVLASLPNSFDQFVKDFLNSDMEMSVSKLYEILNAA